MGEYSEECILAFLKNQGQLYDEPVAETYEEAEEFLEDCMAVVVRSVKEVRECIWNPPEQMWKVCQMRILWMLRKCLLWETVPI